MKPVLTTLLTILILGLWSILYLLTVYSSDVLSLLSDETYWKIMNWLSDNISYLDTLFLIVTAILIVLFYVFGYNDGKKKNNNQVDNLNNEKRMPDRR